MPGVSSLGGAGTWRLPNINELLSIVDYANSSKWINTYYFTTSVANGYWSSSTTAGNTSGAWSVYFYNGSTYNNGKSNGNYVRCVRGQ